MERFTTNNTGNIVDPMAVDMIQRLQKQLADAQATIAALQAELERTKSEMASELELQVNTVVREREQLKSHLTE